MKSERQYTPAAGHSGELAAYDDAVRAYTKEAVWRPLMVQRINPQPSQTIVDIGAGTGTLAVALKKRCPEATVIAFDPDRAALELARAKAKAESVEIDWRLGFAEPDAFAPDTVDHATCSLVLHQVPLSEKRAILETMCKWTKGVGTIHIADYGRQRGTMRSRFRKTVQAGDGIEDTQPNADGALEHIFHELGLRRYLRDRHFATLSGRFSLFSRST